jgi:phosphatidylglycerol:prolipoprotein diacylglycerol transferase
VPFAAIFFDFDPVIDIAERAVSLWSLMIIAGLLVALASAAFLASRSSSGDDRLSQVDLWMVVLGTVPGAVIGGRIGYVLLHLDHYAANATAIVDAGQGAFQLSLAIVGGVLTGAYVARVIDAPIGRWLHVAAVPVFGAVVVGKLGMALGGAGQGQPSTDAWATAYLGDGPWGSLGPAIPSQPAQVYEAGLTFLVLVIVVGLVAAGGFRRHDGLLFLFALETWAVARFLVAFTWRDDPVLGPLVMDQVVSLAILLGCLVIHAAALRLRRRGSSKPAESPATRAPAPAWPDDKAATEWRRPPGSRP